MEVKLDIDDDFIADVIRKQASELNWGDYISASDVADEIDTANIAGEVSIADLASEVVSNLDISEVAEQIDMDSLAKALSSTKGFHEESINALKEEHDARLISLEKKVDTFTALLKQSWTGRRLMWLLGLK